jgi:hypothetical protein
MTNDLKTAAANYEAATHAKNQAVEKLDEWMQNFRKTTGSLVMTQPLKKHGKVDEWNKVRLAHIAAKEEQKAAQRELLFVASNGAARGMYGGNLK